MKVIPDNRIIYDLIILMIKILIANRQALIHNVQ